MKHKEIKHSPKSNFPFRSQNFLLLYKTKYGVIVTKCEQEQLYNINLKLYSYLLLTKFATLPGRYAHADGPPFPKYYLNYLVLVHCFTYIKDSQFIGFFMLEYEGG